MNNKYHLVFLGLFIFTLFSCDTDPVTDPDQSFSFNHERNPGVSATDFLTDENFDELIIEVQFMEGYEPTNEAINNLESFLEERLNKSSITILEPTEIPAEGQQRYSANEVRDLEREHRTQFSEEGSLAAYFLFLDGEYDQANVLGIAYFNTSMAFFGETIQNTSDGIFQLSRSTVETVVLQHEIGHVIGLVNNGAEMQTNHQDEENGSHCDDENCLMYFSVRTTDFFANVFDGQVPELDDQCIADLQAAGGK